MPLFVSPNLLPSICFVISVFLCLCLSMFVYPNYFWCLCFSISICLSVFLYFSGYSSLFICVFSCLSIYFRVSVSVYLEAIHGNNVRKFKSRVVGNDPKFGKIWPGYALSKIIKNSPKCLAQFRGLPGHTKKRELVPRKKTTGTNVAARRKHDDSAGGTATTACRGTKNTISMPYRYI